MKRGTMVLALLSVLCTATMAHAGQCTDAATVGHFDVTFEGADYDGQDTTFNYCVTGLDDPALSHWDLTLDPACIDDGDLTGCGPEPCYYQLEDPTTGITGIKWDETEVEPGETECFSFSLDGDWTNLLGDVSIGLKAGPDSHFGELCGPTCVACGAALDVLHDEFGNLTLSVSVIHNRPPTVLTKARYAIVDDFGNTIHAWADGPLTLQQGAQYRVLGPIPDLPTLPPGKYKIWMKMQGMADWIVRGAIFEIPEPE